MTTMRIASAQQHLSSHPVSLSSCRPSGRHVVVPPRQHRRVHSCVYASSSGSASSDEFSRKARQFVSQKSAEFNQFVEEQRLQEKAEQLTDTVSQKARDAFDEADKRMSLRRRARNLWLVVKEKAPRVQRQASEFVESPLGRISLVMLGLYALSTGLVFRLLNIFFIMLWVAPLFLPLFARYANRKAMEEQEAFAEQQRQQQQRRNPFSGFPFGRGGVNQQQEMRRNDKFSQQTGGPIIDAEWETIDDTK